MVDDDARSAVVTQAVWLREFEFDASSQLSWINRVDHE
jgi:hypothetical protein